MLCLFALYELAVRLEQPQLALIGLAAIPFGTVALLVLMEGSVVAFAFAALLLYS